VGILSKRELHLRVLLGEIIIFERLKLSDKNNERFSEDAPKQINDYLKLITNNPANDDAWRDYTKAITRMSSMTLERKTAIESFSRAILDKKPKEWDGVIKEELKERKDLKELENILKPGDKWILPILMDDIDYESFRGANFDLRMGETVYVSTERVPKKLKSSGKDVLAIEPGEFGLLMTQEYMFVPPDLLGIISIRMTHKQKGLVNISGFHVDPGYYGRLMFSVFNAGPKDVLLRYRDKAFMIIFDKLTDPLEDAKCPKSRWVGMDDIPMETLSGLPGSSVSVRKLDERLKRIEIRLPIIITLFIGLLAAFIGWILSHPAPAA
jgi:dCTP deaminase